ncbi:ABC transporter permease subunit [Gordonia sp. (in: high G+C Gram-positive bacteria)]|uniref:ABC transporter permease subunit n=1 Tax=Gordonia sp. (in: high G+C Gram-positive bacteria) TaxID=84139 RepID=UPI00169124FB|nr:ABC transporter permease subunit [Gordonia sp. (in: high G+C Gram-positive bacteria)]NLG45676.1 ABC transporter permease [Gordonia sp. (in: high G+C Gram-positive bacteria)]
MTATYAAVDTTAAPIPLGRLVRVEMRKLVDTRAGFWLIASMGLIAVLVMVIMLIIASVSSPTSGDANIGFADFFGLMNTPTGFLLPVMAILLVTSEWSQRGALATFTMEPRRERVVIAKLITSLVAALAAVAVALIVGAVGNVIAGLILDDPAGSWSMPISFLTGATLLQIAGLLLGFGFAALFLNTPAAIVAYFILPSAIGLVLELIPALKEHDIALWISPNSSGALMSETWPDSTQWSQFLVSHLIWIGIPMVFGIRRIMRAEVK